MKRYLLIPLSLLLIIAGCGSRSSLLLEFDDFNMRFADNDKRYSEMVVQDREGVRMIKELQEEQSANDTGFINSLFIIQTTVESGTVLPTLVDENSKHLEIKLISYLSTQHTSRNLSCKHIEYP